MKKIGLVLPEPPQYSETFFNLKIRELLYSGFDVIVFTGRKTKVKFFFRNICANPIFQDRPILQFFFTLKVLLFTFIKSPLKSYRLFSLEKIHGSNLTQALKVIYINAHIIPYKLDWLHFGFATMALKRENVAKAIGAKMGVSFRGYDINIYPLKSQRCYDKLWRSVDKIHTISNYLYSKGLMLGLSEDVPHEKITPAIDLTLFEIKKNLGEIKNPINILSVGRLNWIKNYETAISAMKILKERGVEFIYNIIGTGKEFERLKFAVYQSGLEDEIFFLGQMEHAKVKEKMDESDIYLQASFQEGFCVSVLEAQAIGLLCVVSDADGLKENIINNVTGWIVSKREPEAFAQKIIEIIKLPVEKRKEIAMNARRRIESEFTIEEQKIKFAKFFNE